MLKTLEDAKAAQAVVLRNRLKRCGWASSLQEACEQPSSADPARVKEAVCGLLAAGIELPFRINIYLFQLHANKAFRDIADAKGNAEVAAAIDRYAEMLSPLSNDPATQLDEFDPFHPKVACLVAQLLDEMSQVSTEKQTDECLAQAKARRVLGQQVMIQAPFAFPCPHWSPVSLAGVGGQHAQLLLERRLCAAGSRSPRQRGRKSGDLGRASHSLA